MSYSCLLCCALLPVFYSHSLQYMDLNYHGVENWFLVPGICDIDE